MKGLNLERAILTEDPGAGFSAGPGRIADEPGAAALDAADPRIPRKLGLVDSGETARTALAPERTAPAAKPGPRVVIAHEPFSPRCETIRALRTELLLRHDSVEQANIFALISPRSGEGRSQLAAELATSFAQLGRRTLLVDADLRQPQQHLLFGVDNRVGLSQALSSGDAPLLNPVTGTCAMYLLTAGEVPPNPLELLSDRRFETLVQQWRSDFDFVVLDTPPLSQCADGLAVATIVGRVLALSRAHHTSFREMGEMVRRLAATQAQVLGSVLSHF